MTVTMREMISMETQMTMILELEMEGVIQQNNAKFCVSQGLNVISLHIDPAYEAVG